MADSQRDKGAGLGWAILVVWNDGTEEYLHEGMGVKTARFHSREAAQQQRDFMWIGMEGECQSISVIRHPGI